MIDPIHTQKEPDLAFAGLALLILFGFLIWHDNPIRSSRPLDSSVMQSPYTHIIDNTYESWLWQDPFGQNHSAEENFENKKVNSVVDKKSQCYSKIEEAIESITKTKEKKPVELLASIVKVRPNTIENKEFRIRHRYAVIAGLIESGYKASEPNSLHFCSIQNLGKDNKKNQGKDNKKNQDNDNKVYRLRWERFVYEGTDRDPNKPDDIILIWVDSNAVTASKSFQIFAEDLNKKAAAWVKNLYVFDWVSSITKEDIEKEYKKYEKVKIKKPIDEKDGIKDGITEKLITDLVKELDWRGIKKSSEIAIITEQGSEKTHSLLEKFCKSFFNQIERRDPNAQDDLCEKQNFYYLKGLDAYQQVIDKHHKAEDHQTAKKLNDRFSKDDLHNPPVGPTQYDYLHRLAKQIKETRDGIDLKERVKGVKAVVIFGSDIYDKLVILQALRTEMPHIPVFTTNLDAQMFHPQRWRWTRNLVVASHFDLRLNKDYQKHIPAFRDSRQTDIYYNTINTLKKLPENADIPSLVFEVGRKGSVRMEPLTESEKIHPEDDRQQQDKEKKSIHPEDDRQQQDKEKKSIHPEDDRQEQVKKKYWLLLGIIVVLILLPFQFHPHSLILILWLCLTAGVVFSLAWLAISSGEPLSFTEGISLWPAILVRIIAISLAVFLILIAVCILEKNFDRLNKKHFTKHEHLKTLIPYREPLTIKEGFEKIVSFIKNTLSKPKPVNNNTKDDPFFLKKLLIFVFFIISSCVYIVNDKNPVDFPIEQCLAALFLITVLYILIERTGIANDWAVSHWIEKDNCYHDGKNPTKDSCRKLIKLESRNYKKGLWEEYFDLGRLKWRSARVLMMWLFFAIIETILFYLLPSGPQPCRGEFTCFLDWLAGIMSFIVIMLLIFLVLDAVRLNFYWIRKLRKKHPLLVYKSLPLLLLNDQEKNELKPLVLLEKMIILVAERTRAVDKLIYYPMLCILLVLIAGTTYFDNQDFPLSKSITFAASISMLIFSGFMIRNEAKRLKSAIIERAENLVNYGFSKTEVEAVIEKINNNDQGAFQPMLEQPVMRVFLLIVASVGLTAGEYLKMFE
ncbi:hypothetical protein [Nitrosomonas sp. Nm166]|uniref:hypothetical protein n=1 Tax=Nitrosomonas sp. Nm166 TaxID=1881054 RepID=UPI0008E834C9|nr:hypothetical protein [Nitrosomonas sp. Nm166]SFD94296.1 hypothetical protein SAMN05428977_100323 [Nitrosomonas sp. Nm166]